MGSLLVHSARTRGLLCLKRHCFEHYALASLMAPSHVRVAEVFKRFRFLLIITSISGIPSASVTTWSACAVVLNRSLIHIVSSVFRSFFTSLRVACGYITKPCWILYIITVVFRFAFRTWLWLGLYTDLPSLCCGISSRYQHRRRVMLAMFINRKLFFFREMAYTRNRNLVATLWRWSLCYKTL